MEDDLGRPTGMGRPAADQAVTNARQLTPLLGSDSSPRLCNRVAERAVGRDHRAGAAGRRDRFLDHRPPRSRWRCCRSCSSLGIATHIRLVEINREEIELVLAMNRLRHAYLRIEPGLEPYFTTGHHDDEPGLAASYLLPGFPGGLRPWAQFFQATATIVATVDAALAAAVVVLAMRVAEAATTVAVVAGAVAFLVVWAALFSRQRRALEPLRRTTPRFPTPDQS